MPKDDKIEETLDFKPVWNDQNLLPVIVQDATSLEVLMLTYTNIETLNESLKTGEAIFWSRSRQEVWRKSDIEGHKQTIRDMRINSYQNALVVLVDQMGDNLYHAGRPSSFYRNIQFDKDSKEIYLRKMERYHHRLTLDQISFAQEIETALSRDEFFTLFQPQIDLTTGRIIGAEALLRWQQKGIMRTPDEFITKIEDSGLINKIGHFVMKNAIQQGAELRRITGHNLRISVNVSPTQFADDTLLPSIKSWLNEFSLPSGLLEIEITETVLLEDFNIAITRLKDFSAAGISIAMDDFGTGYSSLSYLRQLPINRIKIDKSFVKESVDSADDRAITRMIIALGKSLNLKIIAEGVENAAIERFLLKENCDEAQGYHYAEPLPFDEMINFIQKAKSA
jgi:EAL domain-containing protein (putative c-di-GMP-specific phosphodiesterase class I)/phosphoribosyl-AMP cyclohydrolase